MFKMDDAQLIRNGDVSIPRLPALAANDVVEKSVSKKHVSFKEPETSDAVVRIDDVIDEVRAGSAAKHDDVAEIRIPEISGLWWNDSHLDDGKEIKIPETDLERLQLRVRFAVDHIGTRLLGAFLIILDIILMIIDLSVQPKSDSSQTCFDAMALALSCLFMIDLLLRIFAYGIKEFFTNAWEVADCIIIVATFIVTIFYTVLDEFIQETDAQGLGRLIVLARFLRIFRLGRIFYSQRQIRKSSRRTVSQNKRRYQKDGFDLDLTYVTDRVIAMSFPSEGSQSIYRNPIAEVRRFFEAKHPGSYKIYNLCSERAYDAAMFENRVYRVHIDDHNVPTIKDLMKFIEDAGDWMSRDSSHVIAIHCKGGKGRTGTVVCSWLIEDGMFVSAKDALEYFGMRRTDMEVGLVFQGVETASQIRYVGYFERIRREFGGVVPAERVVRVSRVVIRSIAGVGRGNGSDLSMQILVGGKEMIKCTFGEQYNCQISHNAQENNVTCDVIDCPKLSGDVKFRFTSTTKSLPRGYDNCAFYFWINTSFVNGGHVSLTRDQIDNPHKKKTWNIFKEDFAVDVTFDDVGC